MEDPDPAQGHWIAVNSYLLPYSVDVPALVEHLLRASDSHVVLDTAETGTLKFSISTDARDKAISVILASSGLMSFSRAKRPVDYNALLRSIHDCIPSEFRQYQMPAKSLLARKILIGFFKDEKKNRERLERLASAGIDINTAPLLP